MPPWTLASLLGVVGVAIVDMLRSPGRIQIQLTEPP
jgi:hypothetical protein